MNIMKQHANVLVNTEVTNVFIRAKIANSPSLSHWSSIFDSKLSNFVYTANIANIITLLIRG